MKKKHLREIQRINKGIPKELLAKLTIKVDMFPTIKEIATRALTDDNVSQEDKERYKAMLDSGYLDKKEEIVDTEIEKQIDEYLNKEFEKARKLGRLPPPQKFAKLKSKIKLDVPKI